MDGLFQLFVFLAVALVPGTAESEPSTEGLFFKVPIVADNLTGVEFGPTYAIRVHIEPSEEYQSVSVHIPTGLPISRYSALGHFLRDYPDLGHHHDPAISYGHAWDAMSYTAETTGADRTDDERPGRIHRPTYHGLYAIYASEKCHTVNTAVAVANATSVLYEYLVFGPRIISETPPPPLVAPPIPDGCDDTVMLRPPFDPPLRQVRDDGILAGTVACNDGLVRHVGEDGDPLCLRPGTLERLLESGVLVAPPEPPEPPPPPPRGHRELPHRP